MSTITVVAYSICRVALVKGFTNSYNTHTRRRIHPSDLSVRDCSVYLPVNSAVPIGRSLARVSRRHDTRPQSKRD